MCNCWHHWCVQGSLKSGLWKIKCFVIAMLHVTVTARRSKYTSKWKCFIISFDSFLAFENAEQNCCIMKCWRDAWEGRRGVVELKPGRVQREKGQLIIVILGYKFISLSWSVHIPRLAFSPCVCQGGVSSAWGCRASLVWHVQVEVLPWTCGGSEKTRDWRAVRWIFSGVLCSLWRSTVRGPSPSLLIA